MWSDFKLPVWNRCGGKVNKYFLSAFIGQSVWEPLFSCTERNHAETGYIKPLMALDLRLFLWWCYSMESFPDFWPLWVRDIHQSLVDSPHKRQVKIQVTTCSCVDFSYIQSHLFSNPKSSSASLSKLLTTLPNALIYNFPLIMQNQYISCWWPCEARGQGVSSHCDLVILEYSNFNT